MANSVSLIFSSAERICKRAKVDFLRRRVSILVTFPFPESQTAFNSLLLATQRPENNLPKEEMYFTREENIALGEKMLYLGGG